jgi:hypothetical protein
MGSAAANMRFDIEKHPQFLEEWRKLKINGQSINIQVLTELKQQ